MTLEEEHASSSTGTDGQDEIENTMDQTSLTRRPFAPRRWQAVLLSSLAVVLVIVGLVWWQGLPSNTQPLEVTPEPTTISFDELCEQVRVERGERLQIDFEVDDQMILEIGDMDWLETLILDQGSVSDASTELISKLPKLQHLRLRLSPIGDEGLRNLSQCETLWYLNLPHAVCSKEGIDSLTALPKLRQLRLGSKNLKNDVTQAIAKISSLRGIHLIGVAVTDEGLKTLATLPHLESLYLDDSAVTEAGWEWLFREHPHLHVHIDQAHHDRDPKSHRHH